MRVITNTATDGGGIYNFSGVISATNCTILNNRAGESGGNDGGGIYNAGAIHIRNSTIASNSATAYGGGIYNSGQLNGIDTSIVDNRAMDGGGLSIYFGSGNIANSTISDNFADTHGGGVYHMASWGAFNLTHVTINNNTAEGSSSGLGDGGGIYHSSGTINSKNSIIAGNTDRGGQTPDISGVLNSWGYNLIGSVGSTNFAGNTTGDQYGDPNGTTTPNAGAAEQPTPIDPRLGLLTGSPAYHPLLVGSPAIDQIEPANCTYLSSGGNPFFADGAPVTSDQAGTPRPQGATCDIGAYEIVRADLTISKRASTDSITTGGQLTYTLAVTNLGPQPARDVILTDALPDGVTFISASSNLAVCGQIGGFVTCTLPLLNVVPVSPSLQVTVTIMAPTAAGVITNTAAVTSTTPDQTTPNVATATTTIKPIATPRAATLISPAGVISDTTPTYAWSEVPEATWYKLWVDETAAGNVIKQWFEGARVCTGGVCAATPSTILNQGEHIWWVQTWNETGYGPWSDGLDFWVGDFAPPGAPVQLAPSGANIGSNPTYMWQGVPTATWYQLYVSDALGGLINQWVKARDACSGGTCAFTPGVVLSEGPHEWWVRAWSMAGLGPWSGPLLFTVGPPVPAGAATLITPSGTISDTTPTYSWEVVASSSWYHLWVEGPSGTVIRDQWYQASKVCDRVTRTCAVTPAVVLEEGAHSWWVKTWNLYGGTWSRRMDFNVSLAAAGARVGPSIPELTGNEHRIYLPLVLKSGEPAEAPTPLPTSPISEPPPGADLEDSPPAEALVPGSAPPSDLDVGSSPPIDDLVPGAELLPDGDEAGGPPVDSR